MARSKKRRRGNLLLSLPFYLPREKIKRQKKEENKSKEKG